MGNTSSKENAKQANGSKLMIDKDMRRQPEEVDKLWFGSRRPKFFLWLRHFCVTLDNLHATLYIQGDEPF